MFNRTLITLVLGCLLLGGTAATAQNASPQVSNISVSVSESERRVTITYDVADAEADPLDVGLRLFLENGTSLRIEPTALAGDVGYPVTPGAGRQIVWTYDPAWIASVSGGAELRLRIDADDRAGVDIGSVIATIDSARLRSDLMILEGIRHREAGAIKLAFTRQAIETHFAVHELASRRIEVPFEDYTGYNIVGEIRGTAAPDSVIIICGHYDTVEESPGADDNGSGVVGMMEAIRALAGRSFRKTIRFIAFDLEEETTVGSEHYVLNSIGAGERIAGVIDFEMIGFYSDRPNSQTMPEGFQLVFPEAYDSVSAQEFRGNFITNVGNTTSRALAEEFDRTAREFVPGLRSVRVIVPGNGEIVRDLRRSDHAPFWDAGYPAVMLTDGGNFRNPNYHTPNDTIGSLDFGFMRNVVAAATATAATLAGPLHAGSAASPAFRIGTSSVEADGRQTLRLEQNTPNPFGQSSTIRFSLPERQRVTIELYDARGHRAAILFDSVAEAGAHRAEVDGSGLASGIYTYSLTAGRTRIQRTMLIVR